MLASLCMINIIGTALRNHQRAPDLRKHARPEGLSLLHRHGDACIHDDGFGEIIGDLSLYRHPAGLEPHIPGDIDPLIIAALCVFIRVLRVIGSQIRTPHGPAFLDLENSVVIRCPGEQGDVSIPGIIMDGKFSAPALYPDIASGKLKLQTVGIFQPEGLPGGNHHCPETVFFFADIDRLLHPDRIRAFRIVQRSDHFLQCRHGDCPRFVIHYRLCPYPQGSHGPDHAQA